ncbi:unnamed protein product [Amoebophrya sp. A120]|nr:unnamed protein product [Amoebophrya sp. A120]|eukprot:GSA120T00024343001.1
MIADIGFSQQASTKMTPVVNEAGPLLVLVAALLVPRAALAAGALDSRLCYAASCGFMLAELIFAPNKTSSRSVGFVFARPSTTTPPDVERQGTGRQEDTTRTTLRSAADQVEGPPDRKEFLTVIPDEEEDLGFISNSGEVDERRRTGIENDREHLLVASRLTKEKQFRARTSELARGDESLVEVEQKGALSEHDGLWNTTDDLWNTTDLAAAHGEDDVLNQQNFESASDHSTGPVSRRVLGERKSRKNDTDVEQVNGSEGTQNYRSSPSELLEVAARASSSARSGASTPTRSSDANESDTTGKNQPQQKQSSPQRGQLEQEEEQEEHPRAADAGHSKQKIDTSPEEQKTETGGEKASTTVVGEAETSVVAELLQRVKQLERQREEDRNSWGESVDKRFHMVRDVGSADEQLLQHMLAVILAMKTHEYIQTVAFLSLGFVAVLIAISLPAVRVFCPRRQTSSMLLASSFSGGPGEDHPEGRQLLLPAKAGQDGVAVVAASSADETAFIGGTPPETIYRFYPFDFVEKGTLSSVVQSAGTDIGRIFAVCIVVNEVLLLLSQYPFRIYDTWCIDSISSSEAISSRSSEELEDIRDPFPFLTPMHEKVARTLWLVLPRICLLITAAVPASTFQQVRASLYKASIARSGTTRSKDAPPGAQKQADDRTGEGPADDGAVGRMQRRARSEDAARPNDETRITDDGDHVRGKESINFMQVLHALTAPTAIVTLLLFETIQLSFGERINFPAAVMGLDGRARASAAAARWDAFDDITKLQQCNEWTSAARLLFFPQVFRFRVLFLVAGWVCSFAFMVLHLLLEFQVPQRFGFVNDGEQIFFDSHGQWVREARSLLLPKLSFVLEIVAFLLVQFLPFFPILERIFVSPGAPLGTREPLGDTAYHAWTKSPGLPEWFVGVEYPKKTNVTVLNGSCCNFSNIKFLYLMTEKFAMQC